MTRVVDPDAVDEQAGRLASDLAKGPTRSLGAVRRLLRQSFDSNLHEQLADEQESVVRAAGTADLIEGTRAFTERRPPVFTGS